MKPVIPVHSISYTEAERIGQYGMSLGRDHKVEIALAVVDRAGHLLFFSRMDNTAVVSIDLAIGKARSAVYLKGATKLFEEFANSNMPSMISVPNILPLQGGVPFFHKGEVVGAVGISGAEGDLDNLIAEKVAQHFHG